MNQDPNYKTELQKYDNPIPSREFILSFIKKRKLSHKQLTQVLELKTEQKKPLINRLRAMVRDKQLSCSKEGIYRIFSNRGLFTGEIIANQKGFGFVKLDKGGKDLRLNSQQMLSCLHGDKVKVRVLNQRLDAEVVQVIQSCSNIVGRLIIENGTGLIKVDDKKFLRKIKVINLSKKYKNNNIVIAEIVKSPTVNSLAECKILSVLGDISSEGIEVKSALVRLKIPHKFNEESLSQLQKIPTTVLEKDKKGRKDLTDLTFITIDGNDSKDFDDAVYCELTNKGWKLFVAIADVAHYIKTNTSLDKEALDRGNSVYFPRLVVPMLPEKISNGLCSLNEKVERLAIVCEMNIDSIGNLENYKFYNSVISSKARLTYDFVGDFLAKKQDIKNKKISNNILNLYGIYQSLKISREKRGVMDFDRIESKIIFDDNGRIKNIIASKRNDSHKIIEECMLVANQSAALFLNKHNESFLYRSHPLPTNEKIQTTRKFLAGIGLTLSGGDCPTSKNFAKTLKQANGRVDENIIKTIILRTMKQASYTQENLGHFGLAFDDYTHFTSPIRRYSDLLVHRGIKRILAKKKAQDIDIGAIGEHISMTERRADEASRDVEKWLKCEYMQSRVGQTFSGVISSIANFGIFVELENLFIEGLVSLRDLNDDYYIYNENNISLTGRASGKSYKLGDEIKVLIAKVDLEDRQITLVINA